MHNWMALKKRARERYTELLAESGGNPSAGALLDAAERLTRIRRVPCPAGDPLLEGADAVLDPDADTVWYNEDVDPGMAAFYQMHEYAHLWLHNKACRCEKEDLNAEASEEEVSLGVSRVEAYSPRERVEREANIFAREVLLPSNVVRQWFLNEDTGATEIANRIGVPEGLVFHQMAYALLLSDLVERPEKSRSTLKKFELDRSQKLASEWTGGPLLVEAGPGTGKTRTLIGRIEFLLKQGVSPSSILALTFSNKAAEEMRSRVAMAAPEAAPLIWMGTFHAFGLDLLRKYGSKMGIPPDFRILDPVEALFLSERLLPSLELLHYQNLYEPAMYLPDILAAISRAKDELLDTTDYMALAERMLKSAQTEDQILTGEKAIEVARVYNFYQEHLERECLIDFGDLISRSVSLLRRHKEVKEALQKTYSYVLVDEYQDVNRASGVLLKEIVGDGKGLWVVGDTRQSIYRFRGASPANMKLFPKDFPGAITKPLKVNYRSRPAIVNTFAALAMKMRASNGQSFVPWESHRKDQPGTVLMEVAEDLNSEIDGMAREIMRLNAEGTPFLNQAILCRSHTSMARVALKLEEAGIPILYLGNLFERDEIRNLLSLVSLACDGSGRGLIRVAQFPEYNIPLADVLALIKESRAEQIPFPKALEIAENVSEISPEGKAGLARLNAHISGICYGTNAWGMLVRYLFARSNHLKSLLKDTSLSARQKRIAIYQFLQFAHAQRENVSIDKNDPKRAFLRYVRRLEINGDERQLRQVPEWASGLNAVRLLTVHASKGLEFDAVFIPYLGQGYFPARNQGNPCPPPAGMISPEFLDRAHEEEEECLFFVSFSRAKDFLCLSRAVRYGNRNSNPSSILLSIEHQLPHRPSRKAT